MTDLNNLKKEIEEWIWYLDDAPANKAYLQLSKEEMDDIERDPELEQVLTAWRFLIIPFLDKQDVVELLQNHTIYGLHISELDVKERVYKWMLFKDLSSRDEAKAMFKNALLSCQNNITGPVNADQNRRLSTVSDWLKDFMANTGNRAGTALEQASYFFQRSYFTRLEPNTKEMLRKLFELFKYLSASSSSPEGFEDDLLMVTDDKLVTTNKGDVIVLYDYSKEKKTANTVSMNTATMSASGSPVPDSRQTNQFMNITPTSNISVRLENNQAGQINPITSQSPAPSVPMSNLSSNKQVTPISLNSNQPNLNRRQQLQALAAQYPAGSLERKAIEEELRKLVS